MMALNFNFVVASSFYWPIGHIITYLLYLGCSDGQSPLSIRRGRLSVCHVTPSSIHWWWWSGTIMCKSSDVMVSMLVISYICEKALSPSLFFHLPPYFFMLTHPYPFLQREKKPFFAPQTLLHCRLLSFRLWVIVVNRNYCFSILSLRVNNLSCITGCPDTTGLFCGTDFVESNIEAMKIIVHWRTRIFYLKRPKLCLNTLFHFFGACDATQITSSSRSPPSPLQIRSNISTFGILFRRCCHNLLRRERQLVRLEQILLALLEPV